jgi:hypothetical protein
VKFYLEIRFWPWLGSVNVVTQLPSYLLAYMVNLVGMGWGDVIFPLRDECYTALEQQQCKTYEIKPLLCPCSDNVNDYT